VFGEESYCLIGKVGVVGLVRGESQGERGELLGVACLVSILLPA
jgi:hypothetical protein